MEEDRRATIGKRGGDWRRNRSTMVGEGIRWTWECWKSMFELNL